MVYFRKSWLLNSFTSFLYEDKQDAKHYNIQISDVISTKCINLNDGMTSIKGFLLNPNKIEKGQYLNIKKYYFEYYKKEFVLFIEEYINLGSIGDIPSISIDINKKYKNELQHKLYDEVTFEDFREEEDDFSDFCKLTVKKSEKDQADTKEDMQSINIFSSFLFSPDSKPRLHNLEETVLDFSPFTQSNTEDLSKTQKGKSLPYSEMSSTILDNTSQVVEDLISEESEACLDFTEGEIEYFVQCNLIPDNELLMSTSERNNIKKRPLNEKRVPREKKKMPREKNSRCKKKKSSSKKISKETDLIKECELINERELEANDDIKDDTNIKEEYNTEEEYNLMFDPNYDIFKINTL